MASSVNLLVLKFMTISLEEVSSSVSLAQKGKNKARIKKGKTEITNQKEQHGEDELNDVGTNVVTLDEEVRDHLPLHSLQFQFSVSVSTFYIQDKENGIAQ